jgi:nitrilase
VFSGGTLYCSVLFFSPDGVLLGKHRKLKPTAAERIVWGEGDGSTLPVFDTPYGKIGALICWENYMPLARAAMYAQGVQIYIAPTADARETWQSTIRHIAMEGRCFVLSSNQYVTKDMYPKDLACYTDLESSPEVMSAGGSAIVGPMGDYVAEPVWGKEEMLIADLDMKQIVYSQFDFDPIGHYARPDVFKLQVNSEEQESIEWKK